MKDELVFFGELLDEALEPSSREDQAIVRTGHSLYGQEMADVTVENEAFIEGRVQDLTPHEVELDLNVLHHSKCSCGADSICSHRIALFFESFSSYGSVSDWISNWNGKKKQAPFIPAGIPIKTASQVFKEKALLENDYYMWKDFAETSFSEIVVNQLQPQPYIMEGHMRQYMKLLKSKEPFDRNWRVFYQFATDLSTLFSILKLLSEYKSDSQSVRMFYPLAVDIAEELHGNVLYLSNQARPFSFDSLIEGLTEDTRRLLDGDDGIEYEKVELYRELWTYMLTTSSSRKAEFDRLEAKLTQNDLDENEKRSYTIAAIHLALLDNRDSTAVDMLKSLGTSDCPYLFYWLDYFTDADTPARSVPFIEFLIAHVQGYLKSAGDYYKCTDFVRTFTRPIASSCSKLKRNDLLEKFFKETLPYSYWNYSTLLFELGQYKKWVEMQIYSGVTIDTVGQDKLKLIAASDPALLLPLYHQAVQYTVSMKNRPSYKQAVRYLKKMKALYKKMKQEQQFQQYVSYISDNTKRLRAFQEELQRGKLIDVE